MFFIFQHLTRSSREVVLQVTGNRTSLMYPACTLWLKERDQREIADESPILTETSERDVACAVVVQEVPQRFRMLPQVDFRHVREAITWFDESTLSAMCNVMFNVACNSL